MVFVDISQNSPPNKTQRVIMAPGLDRSLAFLFDLVLLTPFYGILLSQLIKKIEYRFYTAPDSTELFALIVVAAVAVMAITIILQTVFLYNWGATPGKLIFKMQVTGLQGERLSITQAFLRSSLWMGSWVFFGLPFLEIFGHAERRPLHDRAAETKVITLKNESKPGPHPLETHLIRQVILAGVAALLMILFIATGRLYKVAVQGAYKRTQLTEEQYLCHLSGAGSQDSTERRMDRAIALSLMSEVEDSCVLQESDFAFWTNQQEALGWANLAKGIYYRFDREKSAEYLKKVCEVSDAQSEACRIAQNYPEGFSTDKTGGNTEAFKKASSLTAHVIQLQTAWKKLDQENLNLEAQYLENEFPDSSYLQTIKIKSLWSKQLKERAYGVYDSAKPWLNQGLRRDLQSWMCLEEVGQSCHTQERRACSDLRSQWKSSLVAPSNGQELVALLKDRDCRKLAEPSLASLQNFFLQKPQYRNFALAISRDSIWSDSRKLASLRELASSQQVESELRRMSALELLRRSSDVQDLNFVSQWVQAEKSGGFEHTQMLQELTQKYSRLGIVLQKDNLLKAPTPTAVVSPRVPSSEPKTAPKTETKPEFKTEATLRAKEGL